MDRDDDEAPPSPAEAARPGRATGSLVEDGSLDGPSTPTRGSAATERDEQHDDVRARRSLLSARLALGAFLAYLVVAFFLIIFHFGSWTWFLGDDWGFIDGRDLFSPDDLMRPQNGHWSAVPIAIYQVLYRIVGLRSYLPYMGTTVVLHLTLAGLLRVVMRRAGVGPWVATIVAGTFVLFGVGYENILLGIQISMVGSMVFGFVQLLLSDHDGPLDWRDGLGLVAGLLAIMSSSIGIPMVVVVGVAVLLRRGWKPALVHTVPLAAIYATWFAWQRSTGASGSVDDVGTTNWSALGTWVTDSTTGTFASIGQYRLVGIALAVLLVGGLLLAWLPLDRATFRRLAAGPIGLLVGGLALFVIIGLQRAELAQLYNQDFARSSRYMAMGAALLLPALAVAAAAVIRRWRVTAPFVMALFLIGVPANIDAFDTGSIFFNEASMTNQRRFVTGAASSPLIRDVSSDARIDPHELTTANLSAGFLAHARKIGRVPDAPELTPAEQDRITVRLSMTQSGQTTVEPDSTCQKHEAPIEVQPDQGERFVIHTPVTIAVAEDGGAFTMPTGYDTTWSGTTLTTEVPDRTFRIGPVFGATSFVWCTVD